MVCAVQADQMIGYTGKGDVYDEKNDIDQALTQTR